MNLINVDARHILATEKARRFNEGAKKLGVAMGIISIVTILGSVAAQYFCALHPVCM